MTKATATVTSTESQLSTTVRAAEDEVSGIQLGLDPAGLCAARFPSRLEMESKCGPVIAGLPVRCPCLCASSDLSCIHGVLHTHTAGHQSQGHIKGGEVPMWGSDSRLKALEALERLQDRRTLQDEMGWHRPLPTGCFMFIDFEDTDFFLYLMITEQ